MIYILSRFILRMIIFVTNTFVTIGSEYIPSKGGALIVCNHRSATDPLVCVCSTCKRKFSFIAKKELFKNRVFGAFLRNVGVFPVNREGLDRAMLRTCIQRLSDGKIVIIYVEGTRNKDLSIDLLPLKKGFAFLASKGQVPIIPMYLTGSMNTFKLRFPRKKIVVTIGAPIPWNQPLQEIVSTSKKALLELCRKGEEIINGNKSII